MRRKTLTCILAFPATLVFGITIGYALKPSVDVQVCDAAQLVSAAPMFDPSNASLEGLANSPIVGPIVARMRGWQPVGKIGSFVIHVNPTTRGYLIGQDGFRGAVLMEEKTDGRTELSILGSCQEIWLTLTYDETSRKRIRSILQANAEGGLLAPPRWVYSDDDGDGRLDTMVDCEKGVAYRQQGLEWVETGRRR